MSDFMKKPCKNCPYRMDVKPYLTPVRGEELADIACNPYNTFFCHTSTESIENEYTGESDRIAVEKTKVCAGFLSLQAHINGTTDYDDEGFEPSPFVYEDNYAMAGAYESEEEWRELRDFYFPEKADTPSQPMEVSE